MAARKLLILSVCILTAVSNVLITVNAEEQTDVLPAWETVHEQQEQAESDVPLYNIQVFSTEGEGGMYDYVYQNEEVSSVEGMSWDEQKHELTITDLVRPKWQFYFSCEGYKDDPVKVNFSGDNVICSLETDIPIQMSGTGSLSTGYVIASYLVMNTGTLNLKSELLKEYYFDYHEDEDMGVGSAIYSNEKGVAHYWFRNCQVNISGTYQSGIYLYGGNIMVNDSDINIRIPKYGYLGIGCDYDMENPGIGGSLDVINSNISILCMKKESYLIWCHGYVSLMNESFYTGKDTGQKKISADEAFTFVQYDDYPLDCYRYEGDFPGQNYFMIANRDLFEDVSDPSKYFFDPVYWAYDHKPQITVGTSKLRFSPDANVTRGQMVTFLWRLAGQPKVGGSRTFDDVDPSRYYADAISWAASTGITTGYAGTNNFGPDDNCTREQIVTFLWRYAGTPEPSQQASFTDTKPDAYYLEALSWAAENGITVGLNDGTGRFGIGQNCTRGMCVTFLYRFDKSFY